MSIANPTVDLIGAPFRVGAALSRAFQVFGAGFVKFVALSVLPLAPLLVLDLAARGSQSQGIHLLSNILQLILSSLAGAVCLFGAYQIMRGQTFAVGRSLSVGLRRLGPVIGVAFLTGLMTAFAFVALIVPGIMVACALYVAMPACVIEGLGPRGSLRRSRELTRGNRWGIFGLWLLVLLATVVFAGALAVIGQLIGGFAVAAIFTFIAEVVVQALGAVIAAVVYHDLRVAKEGVDIDQIARVFD